MGAAGDSAMSGGSERLSAWRVQAYRAMVAEARAAFRRLPIDRGTVLYESFGGRGIVCGPEAILRALLADPRHADLRHVVVLDDPDRHPLAVAELRADRRVRIVTRRSAAYYRHLSTAGLLVNNRAFPATFAKRPGQVYLNTWHGTPLKAMGRDVPGGRDVAANVLRNFLQADYLLSASPFMTETLYASAYRLRNMFPGIIIEEGTPRVDRQFLDREAALRQLGGVPIAAGQRLVLYAPTWRPVPDGLARDDSDTLAGRAEELARELGPGWAVRLKVHHLVHDRARAVPGLRPFLVDNDVPANVALAAADVLVTDYSSIAVDHLVLDRPIVMLVPDLAQYARERGLYLTPDQLPGPVHEDPAAVARSVRAAVAGEGATAQYARRREELRAWLAPHEDGSATERVLDVVLRGQREGRRLVDISSDGRHRVLVYLGGMKSNGITTSALSLLAQLDHTRYDVTAFFAHSVSREQAGNIAGIDPRVRQLPRVGAMNGSKASQVLRHAIERWGIGRRARRMPLRRLFGDEWQRCFGAARFDSLVDFSGYAPFWSMLLLQGGPAHRAIWMHNDMRADSMRVVEGRHPLRADLRAVFSTYHLYDRLVSVSPALREVNRSSLAHYAPPAAFVHAVNTIDATRVIEAARSGSAADEGLPAAPDGTVTFVAAGRLSSQKNFARMISAFAVLHRDHPATRLVILGDGPERASLAAQVARLGVEGSVLLLGHRANPFPVLAQGDCFVMSSDHEGQPMVILEARVLGLPVVTTAFASVSSAVPEGTGLVVDLSVAGVRDGMAAFLRGEVPRAPFDAAAYNAEALRQFGAAVGLDMVAPQAAGGAGEGSPGFQQQR